MSLGEVLAHLQSEFPDLTISKIRFLESQGLIEPERTPTGYRKFNEPDVARLRWILRQQRDHFLPLKVIKSKLENAHQIDFDSTDPDPEPPGNPWDSETIPIAPGFVIGVRRSELDEERLAELLREVEPLLGEAHRLVQGNVLDDESARVLDTQLRVWWIEVESPRPNVWTLESAGTAIAKAVAAAPGVADRTVATLVDVGMDPSEAAGLVADLEGDLAGGGLGGSDPIVDQRSAEATSTAIGEHVARRSWPNQSLPDQIIEDLRVGVHDAIKRMPFVAGGATVTALGAGAYKAWQVLFDTPLGAAIRAVFGIIRAVFGV